MSGMLLLLIARIVLLWIVMAVPPERNTNWTPCRPRNAARVTMNDGMPSFATSVAEEQPDDETHSDRRRGLTSTTASRAG